MFDTVPGNWVFFDLDDTLADLKDPMCKLLKEHTEIDIHWSEWYKFTISEMYGMHHRQFCDLLVDSRILETIEPYPNTLETLAELKQSGFNIGIITSRDFHPEAKKITETWFNKYGIPFDKIHISSHFKGKSEYAKDYERVLMFVDDRIENCENFLNNQAAEKVFLFDMPWNRSSHIDRMYNIKEVLNHI